MGSRLLDWSGVGYEKLKIESKPQRSILSANEIQKQKSKVRNMPNTSTCDLF